MDRLTFCRENVNELTTDELLEVYNLLCVEYGQGEFALLNDMKYIETILELMEDNNLSMDDWKKAIASGDYYPSDKYVEVGRMGIVSFADEWGMREFVVKKMNGEAICMIEGYLQNKGMKLPKYVVVHDVENGEFHLCTLCDDGNPSSKKLIVGCEDLHELFKLSDNFGIKKSDIVDYMKVSEIKQYS